MNRVGGAVQKSYKWVEYVYMQVVAGLLHRGSDSVITETWFIVLSAIRVCSSKFIKLPLTSLLLHIIEVAQPVLRESIATPKPHL